MVVVVVDDDDDDESERRRRFQCRKIKEQNGEKRARSDELADMLLGLQGQHAPPPSHFPRARAVEKKSAVVCASQASWEMGKNVSQHHPNAWKRAGLARIFPVWVGCVEIWEHLLASLARSLAHLRPRSIFCLDSRSSLISTTHPLVESIESSTRSLSTLRYAHRQQERIA